MLKRASVAQVKSGEITKSDGHLVVAMRVYPRFLPRDRVDEYSKVLAPQADLFARYRKLKTGGRDQNDAFRTAGYEREFRLTQEGLIELERLTEVSRARDVFLICQCAQDEMCHVDLMLLIAERRFGARIGRLALSYAGFRETLP